MDISKVLFNEILADLKIGRSADSSDDLQVITEQEGDIPGIKILSLNGFDFEIISINEVILGIQYDFTYDNPEELFFKTNDETLFLHQNLVSKNVEDFLVRNKINFDLFESDQEPFTLQLKNSNSKFYFDNHHQLFKISVFDMELYHRIIKDKSPY